MYCVGCGKKVDASKDTCDKCGAKIDKTSVTKTFPRKETEVATKKTNYFASISWVLALISLIFSWTVVIPCMLLGVSLPLSIVGLCTKKAFPIKAEKAKPALIMSIIAYVLAMVFAGVLGAVLALFFPEMLESLGIAI